MQRKRRAIEAAGAVVLAISKSTVEQNLRLAQGVMLDLTLLADDDLKVIDRYGLRHRSASVDGSDIARPAVFLIDEEGRLRWSRYPDNWRVRLRPGEILDRLRSL